MLKFLHELRDFRQLIAVVSNERGIAPTLVEKDYWLMHCLWGLQAQGFIFELKGGTSLSKGFGVIHRFSEDIDIRIEPPADLNVKTGRNHSKPSHVMSRHQFYDHLAATIQIPGIDQVLRDTAFDDVKQMRSAGIRLNYTSTQLALRGVKGGVLLELGFDDTAPNRPIDISSWAWDTAAKSGVAAFDNRAKAVPCYAPTHTFVEKLQTISTKYRVWEGNATASAATLAILPTNFLRHYYDVYCLLALDEVQAFMRTPDYEVRKAQRFRQGDELRIADNLAFTLSDSTERALFAAEFHKTAALYYQGQPDFEAILERIQANLNWL